jgi:hypothetical protein
MRLLPHPFTGADRKAGYRYSISILQAEFSTAQVLDRPVHGRLFFEQVIRKNLDLGRPEEIQLIFNRRIPRRAKTHFRTRVVTHDVTPSLNVYYKNTRIKQYHKENRALRTETTINNTYDFEVGKRLSNLPKLHAIGFAANRRMLEVECLSHDCILSEDTLRAIERPVTAGRQRASGLRFADPRVHALLHALILFRQHPQGFRATDLRQHLAAMSGCDPAAIPAAPTSPPWPDRAHAQQLPLSCDRVRTPPRPVLHANLQSPPAPRLGRRAAGAPGHRYPPQARLQRAPH